MVQDARSALYGGASLAAAKVDRALKPMSLVPTMASWSYYNESDV
jgi:hypothetical protein